MISEKLEMIKSTYAGSHTVYVVILADIKFGDLAPNRVFTNIDEILIWRSAQPNLQNRQVLKILAELNLAVQSSNHQI